MVVPESIVMLVTKFRKKFKSSTVDTFVLNRLYIAFFIELVKAYGYEEAIRRLFEWGYVWGHACLLKLEKDIEKFPFEAKSLKIIGRVAWYIFSGTDPTEVVIEERDIDEKPWFILQVRDENSPWDRDFSFGKRIAHLPAGAYEAASNVFSILCGKRQWYCISRNTKSLAAGDPYTEITTLYIPKDTPKEIVIELFPNLFEDISYEFSRDLYERVISPGE